MLDWLYRRMESRKREVFIEKRLADSVVRRKNMANRNDDEFEFDVLTETIKRTVDDSRLHSRVDSLMLELIETAYPKTHKLIESLRPQFGYLTYDEAKELYK